MVTVYLDNIKYNIISPVTMAMIIAILSGSSTVYGVNTVFQCRPECWISRLTMRLSPRAIQVAGRIHDIILIALLKMYRIKWKIYKWCVCVCVCVYLQWYLSQPISHKRIRHI